MNFRHFLPNNNLEKCTGLKLFSYVIFLFLELEFVKLEFQVKLEHTKLEFTLCQSDQT